MKILDRYILKKFLSSYVFVVTIIVSVVCIIDMTEKNEKFIRNNLEAGQILGYYLDYFPYIANMISPITVFIATVFVTAKMASHTEIIAMLSNGMSFRRLMLPYLIGSIMIGGVSFYMTGWVIPNSNKSRVAFEVQYFEKPYYFDDRDIHIKVAPEVYLYMESYQNRSNVGYKFTLEKIVGTELREKLSAQSIQWDDEAESWKLRNWKRRVFAGFNEEVFFGNELDTTLNIHPKDFANNYRLYETFTIDELNQYIRELKTRGADDIEMYLIEKYIRFTSPFTVIILTFIGLIVSARKARGGAGFQIALGFLIAFIYIIFFVFTRSIAEVGAMDPALAVWIPNFIFAGVGILMYNTIPR
ncbi:MAG: LptF/LptG family permease [Candidatus Cyclobacteriaceae bacterium M3_2C_046]